MKKYIGIFYAGLFISINIYADTTSDTNHLFDWAESNYSNIFLSNETTKNILLPESSGELAGSWLYRFYPDKKVYAGVLNEQDVFVLGGPWPTLFYVGTLNDLVSTIPPSNTTDSGMCVDRVTLVAEGTQYNTLSTSADDQSSSEFHVTHDEVTSTLIRVINIPNNDSIGLKSIESLTDYRYDNGFVYVSKLTINNQFDDSVTNTEVNFSPERQSIQSPACIGQNINRDFVRTINRTIGGIASPTSTEHFLGTHTVESINERKSVTAGMFNTVRFRNTDNSNGSYSLEWNDILTGVNIAIENYDANNLLLSTYEITTLTIP